jgi:hypothetical protein
MRLLTLLIDEGQPPHSHHLTIGRSNGKLANIRFCGSTVNIQVAA